MKPEKGDRMLTISAESASVQWDTKKKNWTASIKVGAEVVRRTPEKAIPHDASDDTLRAWVIETAKDEGYEITPDRVKIER